jgi:hypothetical protein
MTGLISPSVGAGIAVGGGGAAPAAAPAAAPGGTGLISRLSPSQQATVAAGKGVSITSFFSKKQTIT